MSKKHIEECVRESLQGYFRDLGGEGLVTLDGRPLPGARISFHPDSPGPVAYGLSLDDGSYWLKTGARQSGLAPGGYRVTVFALEVATEGEQAAGPLLTPAVYRMLETTGHGAGGEIQLTDGIAALLADETVLAYAFDVLPPDWDAPKMTKDADRRLARLLHLVLSLPEAQLG